MNLTHNPLVPIYIAQSRKDTTLARQEYHLSDHYERLHNPVCSDERQADYFKLPRARQDDLKDVGGYIPGELLGGQRSKKNCTYRSLFTFDLDGLTPDAKQRTLNNVRSSGYGFCIHSTRKSTPESFRGRLTMAPNRLVLADEYEPLARILAKKLGLEGLDKCSFVVSQLMYWPSVSADAEYFFEYADKPPVDVDRLFEIGAVCYGVDKNDPATWPRLPGEQAPDNRAARKQADPETKNNLVGVFCRAYPISQVLGEFFPDIYGQCDNDPTRYTYLPGSTAGGVVIYDNDKFFYSHHATDPCGGKLLNAFDLFRLVKFGHLDETAKPGTPPARMPSYTAAKEFILSLPEIQAQISSAAADFAGLESPSGEGDGWKSDLETTTSGGLKANLHNITLIFGHDERFQGGIQKDTFHDQIIGHNLPWSGKAVEPWTDTSTNHARSLFEDIFKAKVSANDVYAAVDIVGDKNAFHPVTDYLDGLSWDGVPRLDTLFIDYLGAADTPHNRAVCRKSFTAAVARVYEPGCKFDCMTVIVGGQGRYKSSIIAIMGGEGFSDSLRTFSGKNADEQLRGAWLIEVSELQAFDRATVEEIKGFLSKRTDRYRPAYGHMLREFPRQCVFFGTTNTSDFLRDTTGGRRFWVVDIDRQDRTKDVFRDLPYERDQIWAEAVCRYRAGEKLYLSGAVEDAARQIQEAHREVDAWEGMLLEFVERPIPADWDKWPLDRRRDFLAGQLHTEGTLELVPRQRVSVTEFLCEALNFTPKGLSQQNITRARKIMRALPGWEPSDERYRTPYSQVRGYRRKG